MYIYIYIYIHIYVFQYNCYVIISLITTNCKLIIVNLNSKS